MIIRCLKILQKLPNSLLWRRYKPQALSPKYSSEQERPLQSLMRPYIALAKKDRFTPTGPRSKALDTWRFLGIVISGVISRVTIVISHVKGLITPVITP